MFNIEQTHKKHLLKLYSWLSDVKLPINNNFLRILVFGPGACCDEILTLVNGVLKNIQKNQLFSTQVEIFIVEKNRLSASCLHKKWKNKLRKITLPDFVRVTIKCLDASNAVKLQATLTRGENKNFNNEQDGIHLTIAMHPPLIPPRTLLDTMLIFSLLFIPIAFIKSMPGMLPLAAVLFYVYLLLSGYNMVFTESLQRFLRLGDGFFKFLTILPACCHTNSMLYLQIYHGVETLFLFGSLRKETRYIGPTPAISVEITRAFVKWKQKRQGQRNNNVGIILLIVANGMLSFSVQTGVMAWSLMAVAAALVIHLITDKSYMLPGYS